MRGGGGGASGHPPSPFLQLCSSLCDSPTPSRGQRWAERPLQAVGPPCPCPLVSFPFQLAVSAPRGAAAPSSPAHLPQGAARLNHAQQNWVPMPASLQVAGSSCWSLSQGQLAWGRGLVEMTLKAPGVRRKDSRATRPVNLGFTFNSHDSPYSESRLCRLLGRVNVHWAVLWAHKSVTLGCQGSPHPSHFLFERGMVSTSNYVQWLDTSPVP